MIICDILTTFAESAMGIYPEDTGVFQQYRKAIHHTFEVVAYR